MSNKKKICWVASIVLGALLFIHTALVEETSAASSKNSVKIISISPDISTPLHVGEKIDIKVEVEYFLEDPSAVIVLVVQKGEYETGDSPLANVTEPISRGKGKVLLKHSITIPQNTKAQQLYPIKTA